VLLTLPAKYSKVQQKPHWEMPIWRSTLPLQETRIAELQTASQLQYAELLAIKTAQQKREKDIQVFKYI
jgi:predicted Zn-dependent protease